MDPDRLGAALQRTMYCLATARQSSDSPWAKVSGCGDRKPPTVGAATGCLLIPSRDTRRRRQSAKFLHERCIPLLVQSKLRGCCIERDLIVLPKLLDRLADLLITNCAHVCPARVTRRAPSRRSPVGGWIRQRTWLRGCGICQRN
jgi:hypothetical protein